MKNLIRKILKENFDWVGDEIKQFTPPEQFLYDLMSNLIMTKSKNLPEFKNWVVYKNKKGQTLMADNINIGNEKPTLFVDYEQFWVKLKDDYNLSYKEAMALCVRMLEMVHKRKVLAAHVANAELRALAGDGS